MTESILPPIPSIGELIKIFVHTFSHVNKERTGKLKDEIKYISVRRDKHPNEVEIDLQKWMSPLKKVDPDFCELLLLYFYDSLNAYTHLQDVSFAGLKRQEAIVPVLLHVILPIAAAAVKEFSELRESPDPSEWVYEELCPTAQVIEWYLSHISMSAYAFAGGKFPSENSASKRKIMAESLRTWKNGDPISVRSILTFYDGQNDLLARWLLLARAWQRLLSHVPETSKDLINREWKAQLRTQFSGHDYEALSEKLNQIISKDERHEDALTMLTNRPEFQNLVSNNSIKLPGDAKLAKDLLDKFYAKNPLPEITYFLDARKACFHVLMAQHDQALKIYDEALRAACNRDGNTAKYIYGELVTVEAFCKRTKYTNDWSGWAETMDLTLNIENPIIAYFDLFPLAHHYPDADLKALKQVHDKKFASNN